MKKHPERRHRVLLRLREPADGVRRGAPGDGLARGRRGAARRRARRLARADRACATGGAGRTGLITAAATAVVLGPVDRPRRAPVGVRRAQVGRGSRTEGYVGAHGQPVRVGDATCSCPGSRPGCRSRAPTCRSCGRRSSDAVDEDWVRTARAKGLSEKRVIRRHVLRNGLIPPVNIWGLDFSHAFGGFALYVEVIFGLPGVGALTADTIGTFDLPPIVALAVYLAIVVVLTSAARGLAIAWLDPADQEAAAIDLSRHRRCYPRPSQPDDPRPRRPGRASRRVRCLRRVRAGARRRQARLLRALRPSAPRPGVGGDRGHRRRARS